MKAKINNLLRSAISISLGLLIIYLFYRTLTAEDVDKIKAAMSGANYWYALVGMLIAFLGHISRAMRWKQLLDAMGYKVSTANSLAAVLVGYLVNLGVPRAGEFARCVALGRTDNIPSEKSFGTVVNERLIDVLMLALVGVLMIIFQYDVFISFYQTNIADAMNGFSISTTKIYLLMGIALAGLIGIGVFLKVKKEWFKAKVKGLMEGVLSVFKLKNPLMFIVHTFLIWFIYWAMIYISFLSVCDPATLSPYAGLAILFFGTFGFIIIQGGLGVYPIIVGLVLVFYGQSEDIGTAAGWILWLSQTLLVLVTGLIAIWYVGKNAKFEIEKK